MAVKSAYPLLHMAPHKGRKHWNLPRNTTAVLAAVKIVLIQPFFDANLPTLLHATLFKSIFSSERVHLYFAFHLSSRNAWRENYPPILVADRFTFKKKDFHLICPLLTLVNESQLSHSIWSSSISSRISKISKEEDHLSGQIIVVYLYSLIYF